MATWVGGGGGVVECGRGIKPSYSRHVYNLLAKVTNMVVSGVLASTWMQIIITPNAAPAGWAASEQVEVTDERAWTMNE